MKKLSSEMKIKTTTKQKEELEKEVNDKEEEEKRETERIQWRLNKVLELSSQAHNQSEIATILHVSNATITRDIEYLRQRARSNIKKYIDERLPEEYEKCLTGITAILRETWNTAQSTEDRREKIQALSLAKECYSMKLNLLTNVTVVEDAIRFAIKEKEKGEKPEQKQPKEKQSRDKEVKEREGEGEQDQEQLEKQSSSTNEVF